MNYSSDIDAVLSTLFLPYETRLAGTVADSRELIAAVDLCCRVAYSLVIMESQRSTTEPLKVAPTPGFGTMMAVLKGAARWPTKSTDNAGRRAIHSIATGIAFHITSFGVGSDYSSFKVARDSLSHGHALPADEALAKAVYSELFRVYKACREELSTRLSGCVVASQDSELTLHFAANSDELPLSPMWKSNGPPPKTAIFSHAGSGSLYYLQPGKALVSEDDQEAIKRFQTKYVLTVEHKAFARFCKDLVKDISGFTEDSRAPSFFFGDEDQPGCVIVPWVRSTSEKNIARVDVFRVGPDEQRQWRPSGEEGWSPYRSFLRDIANWPLLARRIRIGVEKFINEKDAEEADRLGLHVEPPTVIDSVLVEVDEELDTQDDAPKGIELCEAIDKSCEALRPTTKVFFIVGSAGVGKTHMLARAALSRARALEEDPSRDEPLFLLVSSSGRALSSLEDAVNSSLNITMLLSAEGARALCRNGIMVLVVDGFDELLGGGGYENALGSLEPWFRELGGRGVLVASARSSYYLSQYRRSLSETTGLHVEHVRAALQPWSVEQSRSMLSACGVPEPSLSGLSSRDWEVLRIPFFAKAYIAWIRQENLNTTANKTRSAFHSIFDIVVDQYVKRESKKLEDPSVGPLMTPKEIRELFVEVAEHLQFMESTELDYDDLAELALYAISAEDLNVRPGLAKRLYSLCGIGISFGSEGGTRFSFSHEIIFDCFLALAIKRYVNAGNSSQIMGMIGKRKIHDAATEWIADQCERELPTVLSKISHTLPRGRPSAVLSENLGTLWTNLLSIGEGCPPFEHLRGATIETVSLSPQGWDFLKFEDCTIKTLVVPSVNGKSILLPGTSIELLQIESVDVMSDVLREVSHERVAAVLMNARYASTPDEVRSTFVDAGLAGANANQPPPFMLEAAAFYFHKLLKRPDRPVVVCAQDRVPDSASLNWATQLGEHWWTAFLQELERSGTARLVVIRAGGERKLRLDFQVPLSEASDPNSTRREVVTLWRGLRAITP